MQVHGRLAAAAPDHDRPACHRVPPIQ